MENGVLTIYLKNGIITLVVDGVPVWSGPHGEFSRVLAQPQQ